MTCPMSRGPEEMGQTPTEMFLDTKASAESQVLHERPHVLTHTRPGRDHSLCSLGESLI